MMKNMKNINDKFLFQKFNTELEFNNKINN